MKQRKARKTKHSLHSISKSLIDKHTKIKMAEFIKWLKNNLAVVVANPFRNHHET